MNVSKPPARPCIIVTTPDENHYFHAATATMHEWNGVLEVSGWMREEGEPDTAVTRYYAPRRWLEADAIFQESCGSCILRKDGAK